MDDINQILHNNILSKSLIYLIYINFLLISCLFSKGIGFIPPMCNDFIEITVIDVHRENELKTITDKRKPPEGKAIIVVDKYVKVLKDVVEADLDLGSIYLMSKQEKILSDLKGFGGIGPGAIVVDHQVCYEGCHLILEQGKNYVLGFVFFVEENEIEQPFIFGFPDFDPVQVNLD